MKERVKGRGKAVYERSGDGPTSPVLTFSLCLSPSVPSHTLSECEESCWYETLLETSNLRIFSCSSSSSLCVFISIFDCLHLFVSISATWHDQFDSVFTLRATKHQVVFRGRRWYEAALMAEALHSVALYKVKLASAVKHQLQHCPQCFSPVTFQVTSDLLTLPPKNIHMKL